MSIYLKNSLLIFLSILLISCGKGPGWFKPADVKDVPVNVNERVILTLKYVYDQKNEEIASTLKLNVNTIKSITKRALDKLK